MSKASDRRLKKIAKSYTDLLARGDVEGFRRAWQERVQGMLHEIQRRAGALRRSGRLAPMREDHQEVGPKVKFEIFEMLDQANNLLRACGKTVEGLVGEETRSTLTSECAKAVASVYDKRLYQPVTRQLYSRDR